MDCYVRQHNSTADAQHGRTPLSRLAVKTVVKVATLCRNCHDCALANVIHEVPSLWEAISLDCRGALAACNKRLRHMLHGCTRVITLIKSCELSDVACGTWSNLALIVLRLREFEDSVWWPEGGSLELLAMLDLTHHQETDMAKNALDKLRARQKQLTERYMIVSNKLKDGQQQAVLNRQCVACGFSLMQRHRWQPFSTLIVRQMQSTLGAQIMAQLVTLKLPNLVQLDLGCNKLDAAATAQLIQGSWPLLEALNLSKTHLDTASAEHLGQSNWPQLQSIRLAHNQLDNTAMLHLAEAEWPELVAISFEGNSVDGMGVEWLTKARWQKLLSLSLDSRAACLRTYTALNVPAASFRTTIVTTVSKWAGL